MAAQPAQHSLRERAERHRHAAGHGPTGEHRHAARQRVPRHLADESGLADARLPRDEPGTAVRGRHSVQRIPQKLAPPRPAQSERDRASGARRQYPASQRSGGAVPVRLRVGQRRRRGRSGHGYRRARPGQRTAPSSQTHTPRQTRCRAGGGEVEMSTDGPGSACWCATSWTTSTPELASTVITTIIGFWRITDQPGQRHEREQLHAPHLDHRALLGHHAHGGPRPFQRRRDPQQHRGSRNTADPDGLQRWLGQRHPRRRLKNDTMQAVVPASTPLTVAAGSTPAAATRSARRGEEVTS